VQKERTVIQFSAQENTWDNWKETRNDCRPPLSSDGARGRERDIARISGRTR